MEEKPLKENRIHRLLSKKPWIYAALLLVAVLILCALVFDKIVMPLVAREHVQGVEIPQIEGLDSASAISKISAAGFNVSFSKAREYSNLYEAGLVMRQNPLAGSLSKPGRTIRLTLSEGLHQFTVPDLFDKNGSEATKEIQKAGLNVGLTFYTPHPNLSKGKVVRTNPSEGALVRQGDTVDVFLSSGPKGDANNVPNVSGLTLPDGLERLRSAGFILGKLERKKESGKASALILSQTPSAGTALVAGTKINLVVVE